MKLKKTVGKRLHILEIALLLGIAVCLGSGAAALRVQSNLADKIVRLHVIANSDSPADQALKLEVRDTVLGAATDLLAETTERKEAEILLRATCLNWSGLQNMKFVFEALTMMSLLNWFAQSFLPGNMTALHCRPGNIWRCVF